MKLAAKDSTRALTRVEVLMIVVVVSFFACLGYVSLRQARAKARSICCDCNLKQIGMSFSIWASDHGEELPMKVSTTSGGTRELIASGNVSPHFQVLSNQLGSPIVLVCPEDTAKSVAKSFATNFDDSNISYFLSLDTPLNDPTMFFSGDRNLSANGIPVRHGIFELTTNQVVGWTDELHEGRGNILAADFSGSMCTSRGLNEMLRIPGSAPNRLIVP